MLCPEGLLLVSPAGCALPGGAAPGPSSQAETEAGRLLSQENCKEGELRARRKPGTSCLAPQEDTRRQFLAAEAAKETTAAMWELERGPTMSNTCGQLSYILICEYFDVSQIIKKTNPTSSVSPSQ